MHYIIKEKKKTTSFRLLFQKNVTSKAKLRYLRQEAFSYRDRILEMASILKKI
jgi:hypothetical protein